MLAHKSRLQSIPEGKSRQQKLEIAGPIQPQSRAERMNVYMGALGTYPTVVRSWSPERENGNGTTCF